jgi:hypothetical protein
METQLITSTYELMKNHQMVTDWLAQFSREAYYVGYCEISDSLAPHFYLAAQPRQYGPLPNEYTEIHR